MELTHASLRVIDVCGTESSASPHACLVSAFLLSPARRGTDTPTKQLGRQSARRRTMAARGWSPQAPPSPSRPSRTLHLVELVLATRTAERADRVGPSAQSAGVTARGSRRVSRAHRPPLDARPEPTAVRLFPNNGPAPWHAGPPGPAGGSCRHPPWKPHPVASVGRQIQGGCLRRRRWAHLRSVRTPTLPPHAFHTGRSTI